MKRIVLLPLGIALWISAGYPIRLIEAVRAHGHAWGADLRERHRSVHQADQDFFRLLEAALEKVPGTARMVLVLPAGLAVPYEYYLFRANYYLYPRVVLALRLVGGRVEQDLWKAARLGGGRGAEYALVYCVHPCPVPDDVRALVRVDGRGYLLTVEEIEGAWRRQEHG